MEEVYSALDTAILQNRNFAAYRIPGENKLRLVAAEDDAVRTLYNIEDLNGLKGYVIAPFHITHSTPIVCLDGDEMTLELPETDMFDLQQREPEITSRVSPRYKKRFRRFITPLQNWELDKVVLSRHAKIERPEEFSPTVAFLKACQMYTRSYVYLFHTPGTGTWIGSTPEILLTGEGEHWATAAIAGTQSMVDGKLPSFWSEKNFEEQRMVADYIHDQLSFFGLTPQAVGPYAIQAGQLSHLKTDFKFNLPNTNYLGDLLHILHPTPAVCGLPKENAYRFILDMEGYDRAYYSGFLGWLDPDGQSTLYVNLRCMHVDKILMLYTGSGLLPTSTSEEEWLETEEKLWTMKALI